MTDIAVEVDGIWKKFRRGELHDSLRDLVPALARRLMGRKASGELGRQEFWALRDVSFQLRRGEALGVIGPNGAGKSTLLKVLSRILKPNSGSVRVEGRLRALIEVAAGFHSDLTGRENIFLNGAILGMGQRAIRDRLEAIVEFSGIGEFLDTPVKRYSSGMMARLGFSVAAHMDPEVLLVDEVLSVGDAAFRARCIDHMDRLIRSEVSVIFISHNLEQVRRLCDRAVVLDRGTVRFQGPVAEACRVYYDCFGRATWTDGEADNRANLVRVGLLDDESNPVHRVSAHRSMIIEVEYQVHTGLETVHLSCAILKPGGAAVSGWSSVLDRVSLPREQGIHRVRLFVEAVPFSGAEYSLLVRLIDGSGKNIGPSALSPLTVNGRTDVHWDVDLRARWELTTGSLSLFAPGQ